MKKLSIWVKLRKLKYILPCLKITFYLDISAKLYIIKIRTLVRKKGEGQCVFGEKGEDKITRQH